MHGLRICMHAFLFCLVGGIPVWVMIPNSESEVDICMYICMYVCMYVCMYIYIYIYI